MLLQVLGLVVLVAGIGGGFYLLLDRVVLKGVPTKETPHSPKGFEHYSPSDCDELPGGYL